jgi:hypothetical protein
LKDEYDSQKEILELMGGFRESGIRGQGSGIRSTVILRVAKRKQAKSQNSAPFIKGGGYEVAGGLYFAFSSKKSAGSPRDFLQIITGKK